MNISASQKHFFYFEIAKLLGAGLNIQKAATVLLDTNLPPTQAAILKNLQLGLASGLTITEAFTKDSQTLSELERHIIHAGERGGKLAPAFQHLADYFEMLAVTRREAIKSMIYPIIVLHLGIIIAVVPGALMTGEMSIGQILVKLALTFSAAYALAFAVFLGIRSLLKNASTNLAIDRKLSQIPWVSSARKNIAMARFCKVYHSCLLAGISMRETVQLASDASQSSMIREASSRLLRIVDSGHPLGPTFLEEVTFPKTFARSYATGEEAGTLDSDLAIWSIRFQEQAESSAKTVSIMVPKLLYFFILAFVAWNVVDFYGVFYTQLDQIGE